MKRPAFRSFPFFLSSTITSVSPSQCRGRLSRSVGSISCVKATRTILCVAAWLLAAAFISSPVAAAQLTESFTGGAWNSSHFEIGGGTGTAVSESYSSTGGSRGTLRTVSSGLIPTSATPLLVEADLRFTGGSDIAFLGVRSDGLPGGNFNEPINSLFLRIHNFQNGHTGISFGSPFNEIARIDTGDAFYANPVRVRVLDDGNYMDVTLTNTVTQQSFNFGVNSTFSSGLNHVVFSTGSFTNWDNISISHDSLARPVANAGPDQSVDEGVTVTLDGSGSFEPDGSSLTYNWQQVSGQAVLLVNATSVMPEFVAPYVTANQTLTFSLVVDNGELSSVVDTVDVSVKQSNNPPVADAGDDMTIRGGVDVSLDGSNSYDPDGDAVASYQWVQLSGTAVVLSDAASVMPSFTAPLGIGDTLVFQLVASDGMEASVPSTGSSSSNTDTVAVTVVPNSAPIANAGADITRNEGGAVTLSGVLSSDPDGDMITYQWTQVSGQTVTLDNTSAVSPSFTAPAVSPGGEAFVFELVVTDNDPAQPLSSVADTVVVNVVNANDPPSCALAKASIASLWPPNHKMISVGIEGVVDHHDIYTEVTLDITGITQDEPTNGLGDGDTGPDASVLEDASQDRVLLRAERSGNGNGRVYRVNFTASDGFESCTGSVSVGVPHHRKSVASDDGQDYDSSM